MLQLKNESPLKAALAVFPDPQGIDTVYVTIKATFALGDRLTLAPEQLPPAAADEYVGEPGQSSLKQAAEVHLNKPHTDVVLVGHAYAPHGRAAPQSAVRVVVAERQKTVAVFGNRVWRRGGGMSAPEPFEAMPLVWERAYGGFHKVSAQGAMLAEERNPVGVGFLGRRSPDEFINQPVPNIEDPAALIRHLGDTPPPAGFAPVAPAWLPRRAFSGTYDSAWQRKRAPYLPLDFDPRFFGVAVPEFTFNRHLQGGEPVQLIGVSPRGPLEFALPHLQIEVDALVADAHEFPPVLLETITFLPDARCMTMVWRAALPCDKKVLKVQQLNIVARGVEP
ncbi:MAG: DUF2169 domain-containing protein [Deltaproteobacteria bacterium]|nr:DUF2169 domain-containing protein [Deltaproteobacteria bacterium]